MRSLQADEKDFIWHSFSFLRFSLHSFEKTLHSFYFFGSSCGKVSPGESNAWQLLGLIPFHQPTAGRRCPTA